MKDLLTFEEPFEVDPEFTDFEAPAAPGPASRSCPTPAQVARERCLKPGTHTCPAIPNLLCVRVVNGVPFEYPRRVGKDQATGLAAVADRIPNHVQRFIPSVRDALGRFLATMSRFGMPVEALLTAGSLFCRCVSKTNTLSNHSFGDAIDIVGVRWPPVGGPASRLRETLVHNYRDAGERALLRRINACLRLVFATVIDYHRADHRDHFHCDTNRGRERQPRWKSTVVFVQEALSTVLGRPVPSTGRLDAATQQGLRDFSRLGPEALADPRRLNKVLDNLFLRVAAGR